MGAWWEEVPAAVVVRPSTGGAAAARTGATSDAGPVGGATAPFIPGGRADAALSAEEPIGAGGFGRTVKVRMHARSAPVIRGRVSGGEEGAALDRDEPEAEPEAEALPPPGYAESAS